MIKKFIQRIKELNGNIKYQFKHSFGKNGAMIIATLIIIVLHAIFLNYITFALVAFQFFSFISYMLLYDDEETSARYQRFLISVAGKEKVVDKVMK